MKYSILTSESNTYFENVFNVLAKFFVAFLKKISVIGQSDVPDR